MVNVSSSSGSEYTDCLLCMYPPPQVVSTLTVYGECARFMHRGLLWWRSQLSRFIYRPNANVRAHIHALLLRLPWPSLPFAHNHPLPPHHEGQGGGEGGAGKGEEEAGGGGGGVVGIHVRRGDKLLGIDGFQGISLFCIKSPLCRALL
jgi:hypothetical protein